MSGPAYCMRCGARLSINAHFCATCGLSIDGQSAPESNDLERQRLIVNWLRVGIVALYVAIEGIDVAINGFTVPKSTNVRASDWWILCSYAISIVIWSAVTGAVGGRRRDAVWQGHTSGLIVWVCLLAPLSASDTLPISGAIGASIVLASLIGGAMWGARWLGTYADSLVPSAWLTVADARGWHLVAWAAWPFVSLLIAAFIP